MIPRFNIPLRVRDCQLTGSLMPNCQQTENYFRIISRFHKITLTLKLLLRFAVPSLFHLFEIKTHNTWVEIKPNNLSLSDYWTPEEHSIQEGEDDESRACKGDLDVEGKLDIINQMHDHVPTQEFSKPCLNKGPQVKEIFWYWISCEVFFILYKKMYGTIQSFLFK